MIQMPTIITAKVAVKSRRAGYESIFDYEKPIEIETIKKFYADSQLIRESVFELKKAGFIVSEIGPIFLTIAATAFKYEKAFNIKIQSQDLGKSQSGDSTIRIVAQNPTTQQLSETIYPKTFPFDTLISGIHISQPIYHTVSENPPNIDNKNGIPPSTPDQIPTKLGCPSPRPADYPTGTGVNILLFDTGYYNHPYLKKKYNSTVKVYLGSELQKGIPELEKELAFDLKVVKSKLHFLEKIDTAKFRISLKSVKDGNNNYDINAYYQYSYEFGSDKENTEGWNRFYSSEEYNTILDYSSHTRSKEKESLVSEQKTIEKEREVLKKYSDIKRDDVGHGTTMISNMLPISPQSKISVVKRYYKIHNNFDYVDEKNKKNDECIVCCPYELRYSYKEDGNSYKMTYINKNNEDQEVPELLSRYTIPFMLEIINLQSLILNGGIVLFSTGNRESAYLNKINFYAQIPDVIVVGGAYEDSNNKITASSETHGYRSAHRQNVVPDICGFAGPHDDLGYSLLPTTPKSPLDHFEGAGWLRDSSSSSATAQLAGVCALIKEVWPKIDQNEMRKLLIDSGRPVDHGQTAQGNEAKQLGLKMVNIDNAIKMAQVRAAEKQKE